MPTHSAQRRFEVAPEVDRVGEQIRAAGGRPVLVGGWVRDALLGHALGQDYDIEVFGLAIGPLRKALARCGPVHSVGRHFGVLKLSTREAEFDVSVPRRESNIGKGHRGFLVEPDPTMRFEEAAARRDFTINAMGYAFLEDELLDPCGGEADLRAGVLRHVGPAFGEDPLRVLRAMQFAGRFAMRIAPDTLAICRQQNLAELPRERIWEEFKKLLLQAPRPSLGLGYAEALGVLAHLPELRALHDAPGGESGPWARTLAMVDAAAALRRGDDAAERTLMVVALCHAMGAAKGSASDAFAAHTAGPAADRAADPETVASFLARLTNEHAFVAEVQAVLADLGTPRALYARRGEVRPGEIRRLALRQPLPFLLRAARAHHCARAGEAPFEAGAWLEAEARELGVWDAAPEPVLKGRHLLERGMAAGPAIGRWVRAAFEQQLDGEIVTLEDALRWVDAQPAEPGADASARRVSGGGEA